MLPVTDLFTQFSTDFTAVLSGDPRTNGSGDGPRAVEAESSTGHDDMPVERLLEAEVAVEPTNIQPLDSSVSKLPPHPL